MRRPRTNAKLADLREEFRYETSVLYHPDFAGLRACDDYLCGCPDIVAEAYVTVSTWKRTPKTKKGTLPLEVLAHGYPDEEGQN